jgi:hypothetical protein
VHCKSPFQQSRQRPLVLLEILSPQQLHTAGHKR